MRYLILLILALATLLPSLAQAYDVLVLVSRRDPALEETLSGFRDGRRFSERTLVMSDYAEVDVTGIVRAEQPRLILAVGDRALAAAKAVKNNPVLAVMSLGLDPAGARQANLAGISMFVSPRQYVSLFKQMNVRRVGVIHNPARSGWYLEQARQEARRSGIELVVREVSAPQETPARLASLKGKVDALWMVPDATAVTRNTVEAYANFSIEQQVPLVSFAADYLRTGAAAVEAIDYAALGHQAGAAARQLLDGAEPADLPVAAPQRAILKTNPAILKRFGITLEAKE